MASLMNKPLSFTYNTKSDLILQRNNFKPKLLNVNLKKPSVSPIVCKAVTASPDSQLKALNIADDVTQVILSIRLIFHCNCVQAYYIYVCLCVLLRARPILYRIC